MNTEKGDPRFGADPKDFEVDLSQFESGIQPYSNFSVEHEAPLNVSVPEAEPELAAPHVPGSQYPGREMPQAAPEPESGHSASTPSKVKKQNTTSDFATSSSEDILEQQSPLLTPQSEPENEKINRAKRKKRKVQSFIAVSIMFLFAILLMGYLNTAEDHGDKSTNAQFIFFGFAVLWFLFILWQSRKK